MARPPGYLPSEWTDCTECNGCDEGCDYCDYAGGWPVIEGDENDGDEKEEVEQQQMSP